MRYGIIVDGKVTEPTDIPSKGQVDPVAWCNKHRWSASWVRVSDDAVPGATYNGDGSSTNPSTPAPAAQPKRIGLSWEDFRKLFTDDELEGLDNFDDGIITLTAAQKRKIATFIEKGKARGADHLIDMTTPGMSAAITYLEARGFIDSTGGTRKAEIIAGVVKS